MLFLFQKYVTPVWYYNLAVKASVPYWIDYRRTSLAMQSLIGIHKDYTAEQSTLHDAAWLAWQKGFVTDDKSLGLKVTDPVSNLEDNYRFLRRHFSPLWGLYVLVVRIITLHNPIAELRAYRAAKRATRVEIGKSFFHHEGYDSFSSTLINQQPLVSVIIPTLNRYQYLHDVLVDLQNQTYRHLEVVVIDQSRPFQEEFYKHYNLRLTVIHQNERALWLARNTAIRKSHGNFLLFFDDDSRVERDWIWQHLKCLDYFTADISSGVSLSKVGGKVPDNYAYLRWGDQIDTGNAMIRREVFEIVGLFDRQFEAQRMGDGEFGLRAYLSGFRNVSNPFAKRLHLKVGEGGLREMGSWDAYRPKRWWNPRPIPSVLYLYRRYYGNQLAFFALLQNVPVSIVPYRLKGSFVARLIGLAFAFLLIPFVSLQVWTSWMRAGKKIEQGPLIEKL